MFIRIFTQAIDDMSGQNDDRRVGFRKHVGENVLHGPGLNVVDDHVFDGNVAPAVGDGVEEFLFT